MGFSADYQRGDKYYYADNANGYHISLKYEGNNIMFIRIDEPDDAEESPSASAPMISEDPSAVGEPMASEEPTETPTAEPVETFNGIRPEFKEAMDSYEAFFDEYIAFMDKYANTTDTAALLDLLADYTNYMTRYAEAMEALDAINEDDLSSAELAYYLEVMARINQKLLSVVY